MGIKWVICGPSGISGILAEVFSREPGSSVVFIHLKNQESFHLSVSASPGNLAQTLAVMLVVAWSPLGTCFWLLSAGAPSSLDRTSLSSIQCYLVHSGTIVTLALHITHSVGTTIMSQECPVHWVSCMAMNYTSRIILLEENT